jgi:hypothetical protein
MEMSGLLSWANVSSSGSGCSEGYSGVACRDCIRPGYYRLGDACKPCPRAAYTAIIAVVFALCTWTFFYKTSLWLVRAPYLASNL